MVGIHLNLKFSSIKKMNKIYEKKRIRTPFSRAKISLFFSIQNEWIKTTAAALLIRTEKFPFLKTLVFSYTNFQQRRKRYLYICAGRDAYRWQSASRIEAIEQSTLRGRNVRKLFHRSWGKSRSNERKTLKCVRFSK